MISPLKDFSSPSSYFYVLSLVLNGALVITCSQGTGAPRAPAPAPRPAIDPQQVRVKQNYV